jgi:hypothetical protein
VRAIRVRHGFCAKLRTTSPRGRRAVDILVVPHTFAVETRPHSHAKLPSVREDCLASNVCRWRARPFPRKARFVVVWAAWRGREPKSTRFREMLLMGKSLGRAYIQSRQAALSMVWSGACRLVRTDLRTERVWACFLAIFAHARAQVSNLRATRSTLHGSHRTHPP